MYMVYCKTFWERVSLYRQHEAYGKSILAMIKGVIANNYDSRNKALCLHFHICKTI